MQMVPFWRGRTNAQSAKESRDRFLLFRAIADMLLEPDEQSRHG